jgi:hypothetical protein
MGRSSSDSVSIRAEKTASDVASSPKWASDGRGRGLDSSANRARSVSVGRLAWPGGLSEGGLFCSDSSSTLDSSIKVCICQ